MALAWTTRPSGCGSTRGEALSTISCAWADSTDQKIVDLLCDQANGMIDEQLRATMATSRVPSLPNGVIMNVLDVENFAHTIHLSAPGKTSGEVHDRLCQRFAGKPVVTIGYGPDFAVLRSRGVRMEHPPDGSRADG